MSTYRVALEAGDQSWLVTDDDPPTYGLADPLVVGWSIPDDNPRPAQPDAMVAQFSVIRPTADLELGIGDLVTIDVRFGSINLADAADIMFVGRISQADAQPVTAGMLYKFTCSDLTTDLAGYDIGADPYFIEYVTGRFIGMVRAAGLPELTDWLLDPLFTDPQLFDLWVDAPDSPEGKNLRDSLVQLFDQVSVHGVDPGLTNTYYRFITAVAPGTSSIGIPWRWAVDVVPDAYVATALAPLPATFGQKPPTGCYGVHIDPDDRAAGVIDACVVDFDSTWAAIIPTVINRAAVTWLSLPTEDATAKRTPHTTYTTENAPPPGQPLNTVIRQTQTLGINSEPDILQAAKDNARRLGHLLIPPLQSPTGWAPDTFRWLLYRDPAGLEAFPTIFPVPTATLAPTPKEQRTACYVRPIVVYGIRPGLNTARPGSDRIAGQLSDVQVTIADGRPVVDFVLAPTLPAPATPDTATHNTWDQMAGTWDAQTVAWDDLPPGHVVFRWDDPALTPAVTWDQLCPDDTWFDYQLVRGT